MHDSNPYVTKTWRLSALSGLFAFFVETWLSRKDRADTERLEQELNATKSATEQVESLRLPRYLSQSDRDKLKELLSKHAGQKAVLTVASGDGEAASFALFLRDTLVKDCGWIAFVYVGAKMSLSPGVMVKPDPAYVRKSHEHDKSPFYHPVRDDLENALKAIGVAFASNARYTHEHTPPDGILIMVGPKPSLNDLLPYPMEAYPPEYFQPPPQPQTPPEATPSS